LQIWSQKIGSSTAYSGSTQTFYVDIARGRTATIDFSYENLSEGYYYRLKAMYTNQDGTLGSGGIWDHRWEMKGGILAWKNNGVISGQAYKSTVTTATTSCGVYADCSKITRLTPNKNPNAIYALAQGMEKPRNLTSENNVVLGGHADRITLVKE